MSVYMMRNVIGKFVNKEINVLYAHPSNIQDINIVDHSIDDNIFIYDLSKISDISWFHYDILLTHQVNDQIIGLANMLHIPILCFPIKNIPVNTSNNYTNFCNMPEGSTIKDLVSECYSLKNKRFML